MSDLDLRTQATRLARALSEVRSATNALAAPLSAEDMQIQSMPDASPTKWHLAHTTWFFETFVLARFEERFTPFDPEFGFLFNSYYEAVGPRPERAARGLVTRPSIDEVRRYRANVDARMETLIARASAHDLETIAMLTTLGMNHEQQHQELLLTDIHHALWSNPLRPAYDARGEAKRDRDEDAAPIARVRFDGGLVAIGHEGTGFAFDNETPRHRVFLEPFAIASRPVTNGELAAFIEDGGYRRADLWLSDGWAAARGRGWSAPIYWEMRDGEWHEHTLRGMRRIAKNAPACHLSFYEADAYARWAGARLPSEAEWEHASLGIALDGNLLESGALIPRAATETDGAIAQLYGDVWEWTASPYVAYPRFKTLDGALGEYNGKFMCNQIVLRGGSCFTPRSHMRSTYRNFFPPDARWQMSGVRLAWWE